MSFNRSVGGTEQGDALVTHTQTATHAAATSRSNAVTSAVLALVLGVGLLFVAGFAWPSFLHNATHDTRHALGLPCH